MSRALGNIVALIVASVIALQCHGCLGIDAVLEHSIDGITFHTATSIHSTAGKGRKEIPMASASDYQASLESLVESRQQMASPYYYYMRITSPDNPKNPALSSIPLECWMHAGSRARIELHMHDTTTEKIASISLIAPCPPQLTAPGAPSIRIESCVIRRPESMVAPALPLQTTNQVLEPINQNDDDAETNTTNNKAKAPAKDDRTWLQKNWLFVALGFFILANKLGSAAEQGRGSR